LNEIDRIRRGTGHVAVIPRLLIAVHDGHEFGDECAVELGQRRTSVRIRQRSRSTDINEQRRAVGIEPIGIGEPVTIEKFVYLFVIRLRLRKDVVDTLEARGVVVGA